MPLLTNNTWREMLSRSIDRAVQRHAYRRVAFVYMPEHVHLLVFPTADGADVAALLRAIKRPFSFRIKKRLEATQSRLLSRLTIRQRPGVMTFRFWQERPGYDRNITEAATLEAAIEYIHLNPVRRGLCQRAEQWQWSSAKYYQTGMAGDAALPTVHGIPPEFIDLPAN